MKLKEIVEVEGKKYALISDDEQPIYDNDGTDATFDAPGLYQKLEATNSEAKSHRKAKEEAEARLKAYEGISDPAAARKALETVANLDSKSLVEAGKVDEIKAAVANAAEKRFEAAMLALKEENAILASERDKLSSTLDAEIIGGHFSRSPFIEKKIAIPAEILQSYIGKQFKVEDGVAVAYDANGNKIYSKSKPGELAGFDEAAEIIVDTLPHRDRILVGAGPGGSGAPNGEGKGAGNKIPRATFDKMDPGSQAKAMHEGATIV